MAWVVDLFRLLSFLEKAKAPRRDDFKESAATLELLLPLVRSDRDGREMLKNRELLRDIVVGLLGTALAQLTHYVFGFSGWISPYAVAFALVALGYAALRLARRHLPARKKILCARRRPK